MNCPTRRKPTLYPTNYPGGTFSGGYWVPSGANRVNQLPRGDYAACCGVDYCESIGGSYPTTLEEAATMVKNGEWPPPATGWMKGVCYSCSEVNLSWITDGLSNTYMLGEKYLDPDNYANGLD